MRKCFYFMFIFIINALIFANDTMLKKYANPIILYRAQKDMKYVAQ